MPSSRNRKTHHNVNLWVVPLLMSLSSVALFGLTMIPDMLAAYNVIHLPDWFTMGGIDDARAILGAMLGCVSTVLALIFSVSLLVLSMVANLFGPRLLYRFIQDWVTQATIGVFMAAFIYVFLVFLVTHQDAHGSFIPQTSLITSWFLVLAAFGFLVFYSHRVAALIQNPDAIGHIVDDIRRAVRVAQSPNNSGRNRKSLTVDTGGQPASDSGIVQSPVGGYLQEIDHQALIAAASEADAVIHMLFRPGQFALEGEPLASVSPSSKLSALTEVIQRSVAVGRHRVLAQDVEFGVAQIVEIAIRALSPAINDTFTGVACVDLLGEALAILAEAPAYGGNWYADDGSLRLHVRPVRIARLVKQAFDQIRQAAADNPAVLIRILTTIGRLAPRLQRPEEHAALVNQAAAVRHTATSGVSVQMDLDDIESAWHKTNELLASDDQI
jgi:uncharacterized membrane protein